ncbi:MAG: PaaI family thioesterase [Thermoflavifilum sp.]|nr:PaaI family thioesterase [Thermoflavifilum sp.]MCL6513598.1 PaaI family thioesterase [Alicyclobacillus sp.]
MNRPAPVETLDRAALLAELSEADDEALRLAVQAARAVQQTRHGFYFLHHFFEEGRDLSDPRRPVVTLPVTPWLMNPGGMVHGGVTAFLCDNAMGMASALEKGRPGVTLEMSVRYHKPGRGERLIATGELVHAGSLLNSARCEVRDEHGTLIASASGTFYHRR